MASDDDLDSLFGGGDDDGSSLFIEEITTSEPTIEKLQGESENTSLAPHSSPPVAANPTFQLRFPERPCRVVPAKGSETSLSLPCPQQPSLPAEVPEMRFPTVPDPPSTSLSCSGGHTSGDPVVSTQNFDLDSFTFDPVFSDAEIDAFFAGTWDAVPREEQNVNSPPETTPSSSHSQLSGSTICDRDPQGLLPTEIPGYRYADCLTSRDIPFPFRVDHDPNAALTLAPYLTLRFSKMEELYQGLEIDSTAGKKLSKEMREYIQGSHFDFLVRERRGNDKLATKVALLNAAFHILTSEGWGIRWFGLGCETTLTRTRFWPENSTLLLCWFVKLLDRVISGARQTLVLHTRPIRTGNQAKPRQSPIPSDKTFGTTGSIVTATVPQHSHPLLDSLIKTVTNNKRKRGDSLAVPAVELDIPENARLTYYIYIRHKADGSELTAPAVYRHTDYVITNGAFTYLKRSLQSEGHSPEFEILTPTGVRSINSEAEWDMAVTSIYNRRRSGAQVEVDVFI